MQLSVCFALIGIGHIAGLWFGLYRLVTLSFVLAIVIALASGSVQRHRKLGAWKALALAAPIYVYAVVSTRWSPEPADALIHAIYMSIAVAPGIAFGAVIARRYRGVDVAHGLGMLLLPFAAAAVIGAFQGTDPTQVGEGTFRSLLGSVLCLVSPILAGAWALTRRRRFIFFLAIVAVFALTIGSRSALLLAAPAAFISVLLHDRRTALRLLALWTIPFALVLALLGSSALERFSAGSTSLEVGESVLDELQASPDEQTDIDRRLAIFTATRAFVEHPLFGIGYAGLLQLHRADYGKQDLSAHGLVPGSLGELGLLGMSIFAVLVWRVLHRARRALRDPRTCDPMTIHYMVGLGTLLLFGLFHQTIESAFFGMTLGLVMGLGWTTATSKRPRSGHSFARVGRGALAMAEVAGQPGQSDAGPRPGGNT